MTLGFRIIDINVDFYKGFFFSCDTSFYITSFLTSWSNFKMPIFQIDGFINSYNFPKKFQSQQYVEVVELK